MIIAPIILNLTILSHLSTRIAATLLLLTMISIGHQLKGRFHLTPFIQIPSKKPQFINCGRAVINVITAICILAVDFKCFPRSLAKTETYGFGLMDVGVGLYVFSNGIVYNFPDGPSKFTIKRLKTIIISSFPLILLGIFRFLITKEIDYQEHISEYGIHWNFFITLAFTKIFGSILIDVLRTRNLTKYVAIIILCLHEMFLHLGIENFVLNEDTKRDTFLRANREGIISIPGYVAIFLASVCLGSIMRSTSKVRKGKECFKDNLKVFLNAAVFWKLVYVCNKMFGVSRRLANMGYVFWVLALGTTMMGLFMLLEIVVYFTEFEKPIERNEDNINEDSAKVVQISYSPIILEAINYNGLTFFLTANLLTGLVNLLFQTMLLETFTSITIILYYMIMLCVLMVFLPVNKIKLKIW